MSSYTGYTQVYSYGSGISLQKQPSNVGRKAILIYDDTKHIASETIEYAGNLDIDDPVFTTNPILTGTANASSVDKYSIFGDDISSPVLNTNINTSTSITFASSSTGDKNIIMQIFS
jgi:hypothetical protein